MCVVPFIMGRKCCVTQCKGNYNKKCKAVTFRLPRNTDERKLWLSIIPRDNIPDKKDTVVCERHWPLNYATTKSFGKLRPKDPPSVFDNILPSLLPTKNSIVKPRTTTKSSSENRNAAEDQMNMFLANDKIQDLKCLRDKFCDKVAQQYSDIATLFEVVSMGNIANITIQSKQYILGTSVPKFALRIYDQFNFDAYRGGVKCTITTLTCNRVTALGKWSRLEEALRFLHCSELTEKIANKQKCIEEQLLAMGSKAIGERKYAIETIVRGFEYFALSRTTYHRLREDFELPGITMLKRLTSTTKNMTDDIYIQNVFANLSDTRQRNCILLLDEVYVKSALQYHGGILFGKATNKPEELANTVLSFMVVCMFGGPKFLCKILPTKALDSNFLFQQTQLLLSAIKNFGGKVVAIVSDGNKVNQSMFKKFDCVNPWLTHDGIFLLFDFVHLFKNIRNNWITEKCQELEFFIPGDTQKRVAKWSFIKELYKLEQTQLVKMSRLSEVAVFPSPIERQKVSFCLQIFCEETISALKNHPNIKDANDTVLFLETVLQFWKIVNVHSPYEDVRRRDPNCGVIKEVNDDNLQKLLNFGNMAQEMSTFTGKNRVKNLTKDTGKAIWHTCNGLVQLSKHLLTTAGHDFVMLGLFTSDPLEKQFGKLRQGTGGTYFLTTQQIFEKVGIMKTKLLLRLDNSFALEATNSSHSCDKCAYNLDEQFCEIFDNLPSLENSVNVDVKMALVYVSGYVVKNKKATDDTFFYYEKYGDFLKDLNRGGLTIPSDCICQWVEYSYILFHYIASFTCRKSLCSILLNISEFYNFNVSHCHAVTLCNILFNNHSFLYTPRSQRESKKKLLKLT